MADRLVTASGKNSDGDITALCQAGAWWSPRRKPDAISDIEGGIHRYYVRLEGYREVDIHVVKHPRYGKYLRTDPDKTSKNNLDDLPDCY